MIPLRVSVKDFDLSCHFAFYQEEVSWEAKWHMGGQLDDMLILRREIRRSCIWK